MVVGDGVVRVGGDRNLLLGAARRSRPRHPGRPPTPPPCTPRELPGPWAGVSGTRLTAVKGKRQTGGRRAGGGTPVPGPAVTACADQTGTTSLRGEGGEGWAMRRGGPQAEVAQDLLDHRGLFDEGDDAHGSGTAGTDERIDFVHLLDEARPGALRGRCGDLTEFLDGRRLLSLGVFRRFPRLTLLYQP